MAEAQLHPAIDLARLAPRLGRTCGEYLEAHRAALVQAIARGEGGVRVAASHARALDGLLGALLCASGAAARDVGHAPQGRVTLLAVGGYGRGEVGLHSDVDVLFLCDDPADVHVQALAEGLLYPLWDVGLRIGHAVRGVDETLALAKEDLRTATTLLDARRVVGDATLARELARGARRQVFDADLDRFLDGLLAEASARHERFGGSLYLLEPDVKLGRGGLRDLDIAGWAAKARWAVGGAEELVRLGVLLPRELEEMAAAREHLWRVRNLLHLRGGRQQDRLTFADQEEIAAALGFEDRLADGGLGVERFMQAHYRHARAVARAAERAVERARPAVRRSRGRVRALGDGTAVFDDRATLVDADALASEPALALRLYRTVVREGAAPDAFAREAIFRVAAEPAWRERLRTSAEARALFRTLLTTVAPAPLRRGSIVEELHELGLVGALVPEFESITGRVQHDLYHVYTVDVHSLMTLDLLRALARGERADDLPTACRLAAEEPRRLPLFLAALVHDVGKARGRRHAEVGATLARGIAVRLGLEPVDVEHVGWLVERHLRLYHWATRRDVSDPEVVAEIAAEVGTVERLGDLYLLTIADLSTTNPAAMSAWKVRLLDALLTAVTHAIERAAPPDARRRADELRDELFRAVAGTDDEEAVRAFVGTMPDRYVLATPVEAVRAHALGLARRPAVGVRLFRCDGPTAEHAELVLAAPDRPGLLAEVTAVLAAHRLAVDSAQIFTRRTSAGPDGVAEAFDVFHVRAAGGARAPAGGPLAPALLERVERDLGALVRGETTCDALLERLPRSPAWANRHVPEVATEVHVDNAASSRFTVVDVFTRDRLGLLHVLARTLHAEGLTIALSKVSTEGHRAADVFYVRDAAGGKVADPSRLARLAVVIREALAAFHARFEDGAA